MSPSLKRKLSSSARTVSPPPLRRRIEPPRFVRPRAPTVVADNPNNSRRICLYSWNVNGIGALLQKQIAFTANSTYPLRTFLKRHDWPQFLCLQEVKINRDDRATQRRVELAANAAALPEEPTYTTYFSLPRDKHNATGFGGKVHGVATLIRDDAVASYKANTTLPDWDLEGRVLIHELKALSLVVVNGYWVNGTTNPYRNPTSGKVEGTRHDHKLRFHAHMAEFWKATEESGRHVLLLGDMNVAPKRIDGHPNLRTSPVQHVVNRADFNAKFLDDKNVHGLRGIDVFRYFHGDTKRYTYHGRGRPWGESCDRVDLIVASRQLVLEDKAVSAADICDTPEERGHSDHVPLWVTINASMLESIGSGGGNDTQNEQAKASAVANQ